MVLVFGVRLQLNDVSVDGKEFARCRTRLPKKCIFANFSSSVVNFSAYTRGCQLAIFVTNFFEEIFRPIYLLIEILYGFFSIVRAIFIRISRQFSRRPLRGFRIFSVSRIPSSSSPFYLFFSGAIFAHIFRFPARLSVFCGQFCLGRAQPPSYVRLNVR